MSDDNVYTRTMHRALQTLGGAETLARALGASVREVEAWMAGQAVPPTGVFLKAIDIVASAGWHARGPRES